MVAYLDTARRLQITETPAFAVLRPETASNSQRTIRRYEASLMWENPFARKK